MFSGSLETRAQAHDGGSAGRTLEWRPAFEGSGKEVPCRIGSQGGRGMLNSRLQRRQASQSCLGSVLPAVVPMPGMSAMTLSSYTASSLTLWSSQKFSKPHNKFLFCLNQQNYNFQQRSWLIQYSAWLQCGGTSTELRITNLSSSLSSAPNSQQDYTNQSVWQAQLRIWHMAVICTSSASSAKSRRYCTWIPCEGQ